MIYMEQTDIPPLLPLSRGTPAARLLTVALDCGLASGCHNYERHGPLSAQLAARHWRPLLNQLLSQSAVIACHS